ncbi:MAG: hypothetical protein FGM27_05880 [Candidatus Omnitrophica bacterium]|nr:hypothetical protein [Candidatus Omnitrophota bacterium]
MNAKAGEPTLGVWKHCLGGALVWWVLGLNLFIYHGAAVFLASFFLMGKRSSGKGLFIPASAVTLFFLSAVYLFSIALNAAANEPSRVLAACYNLSFWLMGMVLITAMANAFKLEEIPEVFEAFRKLSILICVLTLAVVFFMLRDSGPIEFRTPLYGFSQHLGNTALIKDSFVLKPLMVDWFASYSRLRLNLLGPYPTASAGLIMIVLAFLMNETRKLKHRNRLWQWGVLGLNAAALFLTLSRMSILAFFLAVAAAWFLEKKKVLLWVLFSAGVLLLLLPWMIPFSEWMMGLRGGSTSTRLSLYRYTIDQLDGLDWIVGVGIKAREEGFAIPIGSHSTYVSLLYKTGALGLFLFTAFQARLILSWIQLKEYARSRRNYFFFWRVCGYVFISMGFWMITEDIDAPQLLAFLYFSLVGMFEGFQKKLRDEQKEKTEYEEAKRRILNSRYQGQPSRS